MATDWMWAVAIVLAAYGWTVAMVDDKETKMAKKKKNKNRSVRVYELKGNGNFDFHSIIARPDLLLETLGWFVTDNDKDSIRGQLLLRRVYDIMADNDTIVVPAFASIYGEEIADEYGGIIMDRYRVSVDNVLKCFRLWVTLARMKPDARAQDSDAINELSKYFASVSRMGMTRIEDFDYYHRPIEAHNVFRASHEK